MRSGVIANAAFEGQQTASKACWRSVPLEAIPGKEKHHRGTQA